MEISYTLDFSALVLMPHAFTKPSIYINTVENSEYIIENYHNLRIHKGKHTLFKVTNLMFTYLYY